MVHSRECFVCMHEGIVFIVMSTANEVQQTRLKALQYFIMANLFVNVVRSVPMQVSLLAMVSLTIFARRGGGGCNSCNLGVDQQMNHSTWY